MFRNDAVAAGFRIWVRNAGCPSCSRARQVYLEVLRHRRGWLHRQHARRQTAGARRRRRGLRQFFDGLPRISRRRAGEPALPPRRRWPTRCRHAVGCHARLRGGGAPCGQCGCALWRRASDEGFGAEYDRDLPRARGDAGQRHPADRILLDRIRLRGGCRHPDARDCAFPGPDVALRRLEARRRGVDLGLCGRLRLPGRRVPLRLDPGPPLHARPCLRLLQATARGSEKAAHPRERAAAQVLPARRRLRGGDPARSRQLRW